MAKTVFDVLVSKYEEDIASSTEFLVTGRAESFDKYRELVGRIQGLRLAVQTTKDLSRNFMEDEDNE
jgi:hypothetical protein